MQDRLNRKLPNFLVIGAQKCGTTSLCGALSRHPEVFFSEPKEPQFFALDDLYKEGLNHYAALFNGVKNESAVGEGSTTYTMHARYPETAGRIAKDLPGARLIYIVRHPMRRLESEYMHRKFTGRTDAPFEEELPRLLDTTLYWKQLSAYRKFYPDSRIRVVIFEDFVREPELVLRQLLEFLDIDSRAMDPQWIQHRNLSQGRRFEKRLLRQARALPLYNFASGFMPAWVKRAFRLALTDSIKGRPVLPPAKRAEVRQSIQIDAREILEFCEKPADFWNLDD